MPQIGHNPVQPPEPINGPTPVPSETPNKLPWPGGETLAAPDSGPPPAGFGGFPEVVGPFRLQSLLGHSGGLALARAHDERSEPRLLMLVSLRAARSESEGDARAAEERRVAEATADMVRDSELVIHAHGGVEVPGGGRLLFWALPDRPAEAWVKPIETPEEWVGLIRSIARHLQARHEVRRGEPLLSTALLVVGPDDTPVVAGLPVFVTSSWIDTVPGVAPLQTDAERGSRAARPEGDVLRLGRIATAAAERVRLDEPLSRLAAWLGGGSDVAPPTSAMAVLEALDELWPEEGEEEPSAEEEVPDPDAPPPPDPLLVDSWEWSVPPPPPPKERPGPSSGAVPPGPPGRTGKEQRARMTAAPARVAARRAPSGEALLFAVGRRVEGAARAEGASDPAASARRSASIAAVPDSLRSDANRLPLPARAPPRLKPSPRLLFGRRVDDIRWVVAGVAMVGALSLLGFVLRPRTPGGVVPASRSGVAGDIVRLDSDPPGATVVSVRDGSTLGQTPLEFVLVPRSRSTVIVASAGYEPMPVVLAGRGGLSVQLTRAQGPECALPPEDGGAGAALELLFGSRGDGTAVKGAAVVRAKADQPQVGADVIRCSDTGKPPSVEGVLQDPVHRFEVRISEPAGAMASIDGKAVGRIPVTGWSTNAFAKVELEHPDGRRTQHLARVRQDLELRLPKLQPRPAEAEEPVSEPDPARAKPPARGASNASRARFFLTRGERFLVRGRLREARRNLAECLRIDSNYAECHKNSGTLFLKLNATARARFHYRRYLELKPDARDAPRIKRLLKRAGGGVR